MSVHATSARHLCVVIMALTSLGSAAVTGSAEAKDHRVSFTGKHVYEKHTGLTALPDEAREHVFLSSTKHHFWLVLPYAETWVLESGKKLPLDARDGRFTVSIRTQARDRQGDEAFLRETLADLTQDGDERILDATFFDLHDRAILRVKSRGTEAQWAWTYRALAPRNDRWYILRLSLEDDEEIAPETEERLLDILGVGFGADFEVH